MTTESTTALHILRGSQTWCGAPVKSTPHFGSIAQALHVDRVGGEPCAKCLQAAADALKAPKPATHITDPNTGEAYCGVAGSRAAISYAVEPNSVVHCTECTTRLLRAFGDAEVLAADAARAAEAAAAEAAAAEAAAAEAAAAEAAAAVETTTDS